MVKISHLRTVQDGSGKGLFPVARQISSTPLRVNREEAVAGLVSLIFLSLMFTCTSRLCQTLLNFHTIHKEILIPKRSKKVAFRN